PSGKAGGVPRATQRDRGAAEGPVAWWATGPRGCERRSYNRDEEEPSLAAVVESLMKWFLLIAVGVASTTHADTLQATLREPLVEISHEVKISIEDGVATYRVQRMLANHGSRADEASLDIDLPFGGGVTGLRIRARDTWYEGDLMEASEAARLYEKLTGFGPFPAKDPALLQWVWPDKVHLQVFPVLAGKTSTVEYTLTVPTQYRRGRYQLSYPRYAGPGLAAASFVTPPGARIDGQEVKRRFVLPKPGDPPSWDGGVEREPGAS